MSEPTRARRCAWCEAAAPDGATACPACGATLAQRSDLGGLAIPGVTAVDPALEAWNAQPTHVRGNSPSQSMAGGALAAAALGGPIGALAVGGLVVVAASELLAARQDGPTTPSDPAAVGRPSESALRAAASLEAMDRERCGAPGIDAPGASGPGVDGSAANSDNSTRD